MRNARVRCIPQRPVSICREKESGDEDEEGENSRCENPRGEYARDGALARNVHQLENDFRVRVFLEIFFKFAVVERFVRRCSA